MEATPIYEILLRTQCDSYNQILYLLDRISRCDDGLIYEASKDNPSPSRIADFTNHKSDLIAEIDRLTVQIEKNQIKLLGTMSLVIEGDKHPLWERLIILQELVRRRIDHIIFEEDRQNTLLCESLTEYKERLELDKQIAAVPKEKRTVFIYNPTS